MNREWAALYQSQDWVLEQLRPLNHGFYLTGRTALSRGYYEHRYSEDLDFFANDQPDFALSRDRCFDALDRHGPAAGFKLEIALREDRFGRAFLRGPVELKLEFINDVPSRVGTPWNHPALGSLDTKENILANKVSALSDREEPKDLADIFWLCCRDNLNLGAAISDAQGKAAGIFPPLIAKRLSQALKLGVPKVFWRKEPEPAEFRSGIERLIRELLA